MRQRPSVPAAIAGNSRLLASFTDAGELQSLYWPHIDYGQQIYEFKVGLSIEGGPVEWLHGRPWRHEQSYAGDTAILLTRAEHAGHGLAVELADFAVPEREGLTRRITVRNRSKRRQVVRLVVYAHLRLDESPQYNSVLYEGATGSLLFYRRQTWAAVGADRLPERWQCGRPGRQSDAWDQFANSALEGRQIDCGDVNGGLLYDLGFLDPGESAELPLHLAFGHDRAEAQGRLAELTARPASDWQSWTTSWWADWLARGRQVQSGSARLDSLYKRSLIALKLMSDERGGGFIAGPECDPQYQLSGGYAYCWGRDAAYITTALDEAGHHRETEAFFLRWATRAQDMSGAWLHRHYVDGTLASSWGLLQLDEAGSILFGAWRHFDLTRDSAFAEAFWPAVKRGADYLLGYRHPTGLPGHSVDLWEKRNGLHSYSSAAVCAGLMAAAGLAEAVGEDGSAYQAAAYEIRRAMEAHLWSDEAGRFLRTIDLIATGPAEAGRTDLDVVEVPDIALLGVSFPFGIFAVDDLRVVRTAKMVEAALAVPNSGAVYRYLGDQYMGGHPWLIASLWLAIYRLALGKHERARELVEWVADRATPLGMLPEQVRLDTGEPTWVTPLAWSHAMFILAVHRL